MQMGYNNDIAYRNRTVHIQTEDHGLSSAKITSQVFVSGAILDSRTISYADEIADAADEERDTKIRRLMQKLHKSFQRRILGGHYDDRLFPGEAKAASGKAKASASATSTAPSAADDSGPAENLRASSDNLSWLGCSDPERMRIAELLTAG